jgi:hypothetical protein
VIIFECGSYFVEVNNDSYSIKNKETGVEEYSTRVLFEAIRFARSFDDSLKEARAVPNKLSWYNTTEATIN